VTVRAVQQAFRRHLHTTPGQYLRRMRLDSAHADLVAGDPSAGATVTAIAARWGFFNAGLFSAYYRAVYDRLPRETLWRG
jgi:transcriptional regulator GlxA family with amidase domain